MTQKNAKPAQNAPKLPPRPMPGKAAPVAATPAVTKVSDLDDEDDDLDEALDGDDDAPAAVNGASNGSGKTQSWKETMKLAPAKRVAVRLGNLVDRVQHQLDATKNWKGDAQERARAIIVQAQDGLKEAAVLLAAVDDNWRPTRTAGGGSSSKVELEAGAFVRITDKRLPEYADVIFGEAARGIKVLEIRGNKVVCLLSDGIKAMLPRGHVTVDDEAIASSAS